MSYANRYSGSFWTLQNILGSFFLNTRTFNSSSSQTSTYEQPMDPLQAPLIQDLPAFSHYFYDREDIPPVPFDREQCLAAQGTQAHLLAKTPPLSREGTQVSQIWLVSIMHFNLSLK